ncbi:unnamed protein product [Mucor circinelloides]
MYSVLDSKNTKTVCCTGMEREVLTAKPESRTQETRGNLCKLKTGIIVVEEKMKQMAYNVDHGHSSHSMILQISDSCWAKVFKSDEWQVIRDYKTIATPKTSAEVDSRLQELNSLSGNELFDKNKLVVFPLNLIANGSKDATEVRLGS